MHLLLSVILLAYIERDLGPLLFNSIGGAQGAVHAIGVSRNQRAACFPVANPKVSSRRTKKSTIINHAGRVKIGGRISYN
jgi:hypothetical protein